MENESIIQEVFEKYDSIKIKNKLLPTALQLIKNCKDAESVDEEMITAVTNQHLNHKQGEAYFG